MPHSRHAQTETVRLRVEFDRILLAGQRIVLEDAMRLDARERRLVEGGWRDSEIASEADWIVSFVLHEHQV